MKSIRNSKTPLDYMKRTHSNFDGVSEKGRLTYVGGYCESGLSALYKVLEILNGIDNGINFDIKIDDGSFFQTFSLVEIFKERCCIGTSGFNKIVRISDLSPLDVNNIYSCDIESILGDDSDVNIVDITSSSTDVLSKILDFIQQYSGKYKTFCLVSSNNKLGLGYDISSVGEYRFISPTHSKSNSLFFEIEKVVGEGRGTANTESLVSVLNDIGCYRRISDHIS